MYVCVCMHVYVHACMYVLQYTPGYWSWPLWTCPAPHNEKLPSPMDTKLFACLKYGAIPTFRISTLTLGDTAGVSFSLFVVAPIKYEGCCVLYLQCGSLCPFWFGSHLVTLRYLYWDCLCVFSSRCCRLVCSLWLWHLLVILTYVFLVLYVLKSTAKWNPNSPFHEHVCYSEGILKSEAYQVMNLSNNMRLSKTANS